MLELGDLLKVARFFDDNGYTDLPIEIVIPVYTKVRLNKLNEYFMKSDISGNEKMTNVDEVKVNIDNITFIYRLTEMEIEEEKIEKAENEHVYSKEDEEFFQ